MERGEEVSVEIPPRRAVGAGISSYSLAGRIHPQRCSDFGSSGGI